MLECEVERIVLKIIKDFSQKDQEDRDQTILKL